MSDRLQEAAERTRLERRQRLLREVAPFLAPGEQVLEVTAGRGLGAGPPDEGAAVRVAATDRRILVLRKKAFRQFAVEEFAYGSATISLGYSVQLGGTLQLEDEAKSVRATSIPELDLGPIFEACSWRMDPDRLQVLLEAGAEEESIPPEEEESPGLGAFEMTGLPPDPARSAADFLLGAQTGILRWLVHETGALAGVCFEVTADGEERLLLEPRKLEAETALALLRRAREGTVPATSALPGGVGGDVFETRWSGPSGSKVLLLAGARGEVGDRLRFAQFVIEWLESSSGSHPATEEDVRPVSTATGVPPVPTRLATPSVEWTVGESEVRLDLRPLEEGERPRLLDVSTDVDAAGRPSVQVRLEWKGRELVGRGFGHTSIVGRHLAAARAIIDAVQPVVPDDMLVEHLYLTYPPMDVELVVVVLLLGATRLVGATAAESGSEEWGAARAVLDALNRRFSELTGPRRLQPAR